MRTSLLLVLVGTVGMAGCIGTLPTAPTKVAAPTSLDAIGAPGGYQVRNVAIALPDLSCGGSAYPETRDAFIGGFKRAYIESWNAALDAKRLGVLTPKTAAQKKRRDYLVVPCHQADEGRGGRHARVRDQDHSNHHGAQPACRIPCRAGGVPASRLCS